MTEFFEVVSQDNEHERYFQNLESAYQYCLDNYYGNEEDFPILSAIEDKFYFNIENEFQVGDLIIKQHLFDD